jgi:hypothetical protein
MKTILIEIVTNGSQQRKGDMNAPNPNEIREEFRKVIGTRGRVNGLDGKNWMDGANSARIRKLINSGVLHWRSGAAVDLSGAVGWLMMGMPNPSRPFST